MSSCPFLTSASPSIDYWREPGYYADLQALAQKMKSCEYIQRTYFRTCVRITLECESLTAAGASRDHAALHHREVLYIVSLSRHKSFLHRYPPGRVPGQGEKEKGAFDDHEEAELMLGQARGLSRRIQFVCKQ